MVPAGGGFTVLQADDDQQRPVLAGDGKGRYLLAWQDNRNGDWDLYGSPFEPLRAGFSAAPASGAAPLHVSFTDQSSPAGVADEWRWAFGDGESSSAQHPAHTYPQMGVYSVTLWVTDTATAETDVLTRTSYVAVSRPVTTVIAYGYDPLYRLTSATYSTGEVYTYTYDEVGNRLAMGANGQVVTYTYDTANRLTRVGEVVYTWDDAGNLLDDGMRTYQYDYANRLVAVVSGTLTTTYVYNGDGHRVASAVNGVTTTYVVAVLGLPQVIVETTGGETTHYVFGHDLLAEQDGTAWAYHLGDGLGSVRQLAGEAGQVTLAQGYAPYGEPLWSEGSGTTGYGFTGEQWDAEAALLFLRARYYEPGTGRFVSKDLFSGSTQHPRTLNIYLYTGDNPINHADPTGYQGSEVLMQCMEGNPDCMRALAAASALAAEVGGAVLTIEVAAPLVFIAGPLIVMSLVCAEAPEFCTPQITVTPLPAPPPALPIPEEGTVTPEEIEWLQQLYYAEPMPGPSPEPEPQPVPQPFRSDPIAPPCPTDTPEPKLYLYHYTSDVGLAGILALQVINASIREPLNQKTDAQWGDGQYFTDLSPHDAAVGSAYQLSRALYNSPWKNKSVTCWLRIDVAGLPVERVTPVFSRTYGNKWIYLHRTLYPLHVAGRIGGWGRTLFAH